MNKRILVLISSFAAIICYGYALGGLGAYMMGQSKPFVISAGFIGGTFCVWLAMKLWRLFLDDIEREAKAKTLKNQTNKPINIRRKLYSSYYDCKNMISRKKRKTLFNAKPHSK